VNKHLQHNIFFYVCLFWNRQPPRLNQIDTRKALDVFSHVPVNGESIPYVEGYVFSNISRKKHKRCPDLFFWGACRRPFFLAIIICFVFGRKGNNCSHISLQHIIYSSHPPAMVFGWLPAPGIANHQVFFERQLDVETLIYNRSAMTVMYIENRHI